MSVLMTELCRLLGIRKTCTTPHHPAGNGMTERANRTLISSLHSSARDNKTSWHKILPLVLLSYRSSRHNSTGFTPAKMLLGEELRLLADIVFGAPEKLPYKLAAEFVSLLGMRLRSVHTQARVTDEASHCHQKECFDTETSNNSFLVDSYVWLLDPVVPRGPGAKKLHWPWKGPYKVLEATFLRLSSHWNLLRSVYTSID